MTFEATGRGKIICRLSLEEARLTAEEGYLTLWPANEAGLEAARRAEYEKQKATGRTHELPIRGTLCRPLQNSPKPPQARRS